MTECEAPPETGLCKAYFRRWYYDAESNECKTFIYGGCGGNGNNYRNKEDCERTCLKTTTTTGNTLLCILSIHFLVP